jgi:hypothetical protein
MAVDVNYKKLELEMRVVWRVPIVLPEAESATRVRTHCYGSPE